MKAHGELLYCPNCGKEVYPGSQPCNNCSYPDKFDKDKFEQLRDYLTTELAGYQYALDIHRPRFEAGISNKYEYIKGRIDAISAALEVMATFTD